MTEPKVIYTHFREKPYVELSFSEVAEDDCINTKYIRADKAVDRDACPRIISWVARDQNGELHLFEVDPHRNIDKGTWFDRDYGCRTIDKDAFPNLTWEDDPVMVELLIHELNFDFDL